MNILLLDPGLSHRQGHNPAILEELDRTLRGRPGVRLTCACSARADPADYAGMQCVMLPVFELDGYRRFATHDLLPGGNGAGLQARLHATMQQLPLESFDVVVMPTAYPLHLAALAACAARLRLARISCGLLMPARFWAAGDDSVALHLEQIMAAAAKVLRAQGNVFFYGETGHYTLRASAVPMPVLLPPVSDETQVLMESLCGTAPRTPADGKLRVGYFGEPADRKGFHFLMAVARAGVPAGIELVVRLPAGHEEICQRLRLWAPQIDALSGTSDNAAHFEAMAGVDFVLALHDPKTYADQMSGLVPEAIALGKPLILGAGCTALIDFLERHAPGSYITAEFHPEALHRALALAPSRWLHCARCAVASARVVRAMKSAERYLALAGVDLQQWPRADMAQSQGEQVSK